MGRDGKHIMRNEEGAVIVFFAFCLPVFLLLLALVIDFGLARLTGNRLQITADAAALAGVSQLPEDDDIIAEALKYSRKNYADENGKAVLISADVVSGNWDGAIFVAGEIPKNAVQVTTRRSNANNNPLATIFARIANIDEFQITRRAVARADSTDGPCRAGGFFSDTNIYSGSNNEYVANFCLYGKDGVKIGSDTVFGEGSVIGMNDTSDFEQGGNNAGTSEALQVMDKELVLTSMTADVISDMRNGALTKLPDFIDKGPVYLEKIEDDTSLTSGTLYIVDDVADFGSDKTIADIAVVAKKEIKIGSNSRVSNVVFATPDKILTGSDVVFGADGYCAVSSYNTYMFSRSNIEFGSNTALRGVQMSAGDQLKLGSDVKALLNVYGEADGDIDYGSAENMGACDNGLESFFGEISAAGQGRLALVQ